MSARTLPWSTEQEELLSEWSDIALSYRWLHEDSEKVYHSKNVWINGLMILLITLCGAANMNLSFFLTDPTQKWYADIVIGGISILSALCLLYTTYIRYAQLEESNRIAAISWSAFQRLIAIELGLNPEDRMDAHDFFRICRAELDRLIEQSPPIISQVVESFELKYGKINTVKKPDFCSELGRINAFISPTVRLKHAAAHTGLLLKQSRHTKIPLPQSQQTPRLTQQSPRLSTTSELKLSPRSVTPRNEPRSATPRSEPIAPTDHIVVIEPLQLPSERDVTVIGQPSIPVDPIVPVVSPVVSPVVPPIDTLSQTVPTQVVLKPIRSALYLAKSKEPKAAPEAPKAPQEAPKEEPKQRQRVSMRKTMAVKTTS